MECMQAEPQEIRMKNYQNNIFQAAIGIQLNFCAEIIAASAPFSKPPYHFRSIGDACRKPTITRQLSSEPECGLEKSTERPYT
jgi:hypothetical protein